MPSWQSKFIKFTFRNRHLLQGQRKQPAWDEQTSIQAFRDLCENGASKARMAPGVQTVPVNIPGLPAGLSAEWVQPNRAESTPLADEAVIFYTHGGGYISGSCSDHRAIISKIPAMTGFRTLLYEYRLAPEHPFPAAMEDTLVAYRWLLTQIAPTTPVIIAGELAGGGLCLATLLALRDLGLQMPVAGIALSPWTDLTLSGESYRTRAAASIEPPGMAEVCSRYYCGSNDPTTPWISPLYGDLRGLPPLMIKVGNDERMRDDSILFAEKARAAGVEVRLQVAEGQIHVYPLLPDFIPELRQAMQEIVAFIHEQVRQAQPVAA